MAAPLGAGQGAEFAGKHFIGRLRGVLLLHMLNVPHLVLDTPWDLLHLGSGWSRGRTAFARGSRQRDLLHGHARDIASPVVTPIENPLVQKVINIAESFADKPASIRTIAGGTLPLLEAMQKYVGVPGFSAPGNAGYIGSGAHAPNEHIRLADFERGLRFNVYMFEELGKNG